MTSPTILLIGAGKMGGALLAVWLKEGWQTSQITVVDPHPVSVNVKQYATLAEVKGSFDCAVVAVKPQSIDKIMPELVRIKPAMVLSIAAGKTLSYFEQHMPRTAIVRAMPNTPAVIGKGMSALVGNSKMTKAQSNLANALLAAAGKTVWLDDESQMDAVTAISGSGPAYMFLFLEALVDAGKAQGLSKDLAYELALQTMRGSVKLAKKSDATLAELRKNVTSPGGTTEAALKIFMKNDALAKLTAEAVKAAVKRAKELA